MPDANGWIRTSEREPTDEEIQAGIEAWRYDFAGSHRCPDFHTIVSGFRGLTYDAWRPFVPPERKHAKCVCGANGRIDSSTAYGHQKWSIRCCNMPCWFGPQRATEREAWEAWDALMRKTET